jgi:hypothetical protein
LRKQQSFITVNRLLTKKKTFRFPFPFAVNRQKFAACSKQTVAIFHIYVLCIYAAVLNRKMENESPGDFPLSVYHLVIMQTEVCR